MDKPVLLLMAAGIGSRYGGIKQLDGFGPSGEKLIDYIIFDAIECGFSKIIFVIRKAIEKEFFEMVLKPWKGAIPMECVYQELDNVPSWFQVPKNRIKPWGTGHAILVGSAKIASPFAVVNADDFYGRSALKQMYVYLEKFVPSKDGEYALIGYQLKNTLSPHGGVSRGVCTQNEAGYLIRLCEVSPIQKTPQGIFYTDEKGISHHLDETTLVSMNLWGFFPSFFEYLREDFEIFLKDHGDDLKAEFYVTTVIDRLIQTGIKKVKILSTNQEWFGVTYREDRSWVEAKIQELVTRGEYPENLWKI